MSERKAVVRKFYRNVWEGKELTLLPQLMRKDVRFRGSLGEEKRGHEGFAEYVENIHNALSGYTCQILSLIQEDDQIAARMKFSGKHTGEFLGFTPTEQQVSWVGSAFFTFEEGLIADLWVLGDLANLHDLLESQRTSAKVTTNN